ncbi:MAG: 4-vinyl reductase [Deltaproteobacteria bacterium]|jgi:predicted hydrocarbon binding protein|nr:4-vinyl reductase [Deltaproteobacteria bacterium]
MSEDRKYQFSWDLIGDLDTARPNLGPKLRLEAYRLLQFCTRDILEQRYGTEAADQIFYDAGQLAGKHFYENALDHTPADINDLVKQLQSTLVDIGIGIFKVEKINENLECIMTVAEDLDCSGLPELGYGVCVYDEGFISGILEAFTGIPFNVKEIDCWCTNERTCRFEAKPKPKAAAAE